MHGDSRHAPSRPRRANGRNAAGPADGGERGRGALPEPAELSRLLEPVVHAAGMDLESVRVSPAGRRRLLRLVVDADGGVGLDRIALVSREVSARLDSSGAMGEVPYTLEVSSPGVDRPLTERRHWRRAQGRLVSVPLTVAGVGAGQAERGGGRSSSDLSCDTEAPGQAPTVVGRVVAADAAGVILDVGGERREFGYAELGPGRVQVEFGPPGAAGTGTGTGTGPGRAGNGGSRDGH